MRGTRTKTLRKEAIAEAGRALRGPQNYAAGVVFGNEFRFYKRESKRRERHQAKVIIAESGRGQWRQRKALTGETTDK